MPAPSLDPAVYRDIVRRALEEDLGTGDVTSIATIDAGRHAAGVFLVKGGCVLAGLDVAIEAFRQLDPSVDVRLQAHDGDWCEPDTEAAVMAGSARALLAGERTALNFLQRLSGIATRTREFVAAAGGRLVILDTRKTTPTLRALEKYAVRVGGGRNHRFGLFDAVLIKDNHVRMAGGVADAVRRARARRPDLPVEVEAQTLAEVAAALDAGADTILLDNMGTDDIRAAVACTNRRARVEISGGVTLARIPELAQTGADCVSVGALTHSAPAVDISFEIEPR